MATKVYLATGAATNASALYIPPSLGDFPNYGGGVHTTSARGSTSKGTAAASAGRSTVASGTILANGASLTAPLSAAATISGTLTLNIWAYEDNMSANVGVACAVYKVSGQDGTTTLISDTAKGVELGTASAVQNWTATPTSTSMAVGDRFLIIPYFKNVGTMGGPYNAYMRFGGPTDAADGDTYVSFNENLTFMSETDPSSTTLYLTDTDSPVNVSMTEKEMWTSRGGGVVSKATSTLTGPVSPFLITYGTAGSELVWYSKPLSAFTLSGPVAVNVRMIESNVAANVTALFEVAVVNGDGTGATIYGKSYISAPTSGSTELITTEAGPVVKTHVAGANISVTDGQRLRFRIYLDDATLNGFTTATMASGYTATVYYNGTSAAASGDSYILLGQTVAEFSGTQTVTLGLLDAGNALYAPQVQPDQFLTLGLLDATAALYAPTLVGKNTLTLGLLDATAALYAPTLVPGPAMLTVPLLDAANALYAPTVMRDEFITLGLLDAANALYAPSLLGKNTLTIALLDAANALYAPSLLGKNTLTLGLLDGAPALYAPSLSFGLALPLLDASSALYAPSLSIGVALPLLDAANALYDPTVANAGGLGQSITLGFLDGAPALYAPTVLPQPVGLTLGLLDAANALYAPTLVGKNTLTIALLDAAAALYAPALAAKSTLTIALLDASNALYAPTFVPKNTLQLSLLDGAPTLYAPSLTLAPYLITLGLLDAGAALYDPVVQAVGSFQSISLDFLDAANALYAPEVQPDQFLTLGLLDGAPALYAPTVMRDEFITLGLLDSGSALYSMTLAGRNLLVIPLMDGAPALYAPTIIPGSKTLTLGLLDNAPALYDPYVIRAPYPITLGLLTSTATLYAPVVKPVTPMALDLLDAGRALYAMQVVAPFTLQAISLGFLSITPELYAPELTALSESEVLARKYAALMFAEERRQFRGTPHPHRRW